MSVRPNATSETRKPTLATTRKQERSPERPNLEAWINDLASEDDKLAGSARRRLVHRASPPWNRS